MTRSVVYQGSLLVYQCSVLVHWYILVYQCTSVPVYQFTSVLVYQYTSLLYQFTIGHCSVPVYQCTVPVYHLETTRVPVYKCSSMVHWNTGTRYTTLLLYNGRIHYLYTGILSLPLALYIVHYITLHKLYWHVCIDVRMYTPALCIPIAGMMYTLLKLYYWVH